MPVGTCEGRLQPRRRLRPHGSYIPFAITKAQRMVAIRGIARGALRQHGRLRQRRHDHCHQLVSERLMLASDAPGRSPTRQPGSPRHRKGCCPERHSAERSPHRRVGGELRRTFPYARPSRPNRRCSLGRPDRRLRWPSGDGSGRLKRQPDLSAHMHTESGQCAGLLWMSGCGPTRTPACRSCVRSWGSSGKHLLALSFRSLTTSGRFRQIFAI